MMKSLYLFIASFLCFSAFAAEHTIEPTIQVQFLDGNTIVETIELPQSYINLCQTLKEQKQMEDFSDQKELIIPIHQLSPQNFKLIQEFLPLLISYNDDQLKQKLKEKSDPELGIIAKASDYLAIETLCKKSLEVIKNRIWDNIENYYTAYSSSYDPFKIQDHAVIASYIKTALIKKIRPFTFKEEALFTGHTDAVYSVTFSPDGKYLASASRDNTIKLWDIHSKSCLHTFIGHTNVVISVAFSPDGKYLASGSWDNTIKLWDITTKSCRYTFYGLDGHTRSVHSVTFSPDGKYLASAYENSTIKLWDIDSKTCLHTFTDHNTVFSVAFSPDGKQLASAYRDNTIKLWDIHSKTCLHTFTGHTNVVISVAFSPDGKYLASASLDNTIKLWDIHSKTCLHTFTGHTVAPNSVAFSPDGTQLASGSYDNTIKLWDIHSKTCLHTFTGKVSSVTFSPDGKYLASVFYNTIKLWQSNFDEHKTLPETIMMMRNILHKTQRTWWQKPISIATTTIGLGATYLLYKWMKK